MRIDEWLQQARLQLEQAGSESARIDAELLLAHILKKSRTWLYSWNDHELTGANIAAVEQLLIRRLNGEPIAYLIGERDFWSLTLKVAPSTLIPRPDTETLIEWALELPLLANARVLDLGTGTGAIALALASEQPSWNVTGVDYQIEAVELATHNGQFNKLERVSFKQSNWFSNVDGVFDLIVTNPPYIDAADPHLSQGDVRFEPLSALVAADSGLADIVQIIRQAPQFLRKGGWLLIEHGYQQAEAVCDLLRAGGFSEVENRKDLGGNPRISGGQLML